MADQQFKMDAGNKFLMVVSVLALAGAAAFLAYHLVNFLGQVGLGERDPAPAVTETVDERIAPVGRVEVAAVDEDEAPAEARPASEVYQSVCAACHDTGAAGAPLKTDRDEWQARLDEKGRDTLVTHAIDGFLAMPARGGDPNLSDEEVTASVDYMLSEAGLEVDADAAVEVAAVDEEADVPEAAPSDGDAERGEERYAACVSCHGAEGEGMGIFPKIAGQGADYIAERLGQYRAGETVGPNTALMAPHASGLSDEAIADLAAYIASL
ncbi:cytochrome c, class I [Thioalkalivibrio nitratireducens DSM 14787]|uniref:Cytochrome c, class I n=1 Tax=Thioalkalivibrio nitratireducens (strain DSM 14787 / UNIQEM 213 / ALEN2) TaxID=1255043 RepID=L0DSC5_THIND|nr:c-type cytochrome [Thioalkalivibrio nitratireducens]AGA31893.1 cytochrome c, class I [Thioalkalivibrio nitratireducens DSM 14787]